MRYINIQPTESDAMQKQEYQTSSGPTKIRETNRKAVLSYVRFKGSDSRSAIGSTLSLSPAAVSSVVNELLEDGLLRLSEEPPKDPSQGRPIKLVELNPGIAAAFGIMLRPGTTMTTLGIAWIDYAGKVTSLPSTRVSKHQNLEELITSIHEAVKTLEEAVPDKSRVRRITIGVPGVIEGDTIPTSPKLTCVEGSAFIEKLNNTLDYPVSFENDVNLAATSELHQQPRLRELSFAYLHLYTGVGTGISLKGQIINGSGGWAGELGSLRLNHPGFEGKTFEQLLSTDNALGDLLVQLGYPRQTLDNLTSHIDERDSKVLEVIDNYCIHISDAINILNSVLDLNEILIDFRSDKLFQRLRPRLEILLQSAPRQPVISTPVMGKEATLFGAAITALELALPTIEYRDKSD